MFTPDNKMFAELFQTAFNAAIDAGKRILEIYNSSDDFHVSMKSDNSPLSSADKEAHDIIKNALIPLRIPILSEEGRDLQFEERKAWDILWIVDPLDGTRQFIQKRDEFTVNIALVTEGCPMFGIIYAPAKGEMYFGIKKAGSYKMKITNESPQSFTLAEITELAEKMPSNNNSNNKYVVLVSFYHVNQETLEFIDDAKKTHLNVEVKKVGSSLKMCMLADGIGDVYIRCTNTYEWDTAAAQAIMEGVGWNIYSLDSDNPLTYNKESLLNPYFICKKDRI